MRTFKDLSEEGKFELALAILLWKDFKSDGKLSIEATRQAIEFVKMLDIEKEYDKIHSILPPMKIESRQNWLERGG